MQNLSTNYLERSDVVPPFFEAHWYAAYTNANHEKRVATQLRQRSVLHFLPLYESLRRWKDRKMLLQLPLFPGYIFVRLAARDHLQVLQVPGVVRLVGFNGLPYALLEEEIQAIQNCLNRNCRAKPYPYLQVGRRARVKSGSLQGLEGIVLRKKHRTRFVISFEMIMRSVEVDIDGMELELVDSSSRAGRPVY